MDMMQFNAETQALEHEWATDPQWAGITRPYSAADVVRLRGSVRIDYTIARLGADRLRDMLSTGSLVRTFGAMSDAQAAEMVRAGLQAIYLSGWQVAADANLAGHTYADQSLYPSYSVPALVRRLNNALLRADQIEWAEGRRERDWLVPIVADAETGLGGPVHAFELMKVMIEAGAAGVHFEDQSAADRKCGQMRGKVIVPTAQFERTLAAARLAADVLDVPSVVVARTDSLGASSITSDVDDRDRPFLTGERTAEGYFRVKGGMKSAIARGRAFARVADIVWCETPAPDLREARQFAEGVHDEFPGKLLAYNCSASFNWQRNLDASTIARFQRELAAMGYVFQFTTLAGWHLVNAHTFELAQAYADRVLTTITGDAASTAPHRGSPETEQLRPMIAPIVGDAPPIEDTAFPLPRAPGWTGTDLRERHD